MAKVRFVKKCEWNNYEVVFTENNDHVKHWNIQHFVDNVLLRNEDVSTYRARVAIEEFEELGYKRID